MYCTVCTCRFFHMTQEICKEIQICLILQKTCHKLHNVHRGLDKKSEVNLNRCCSAPQTLAQWRPLHHRLLIPELTSRSIFTAAWAIFIRRIYSGHRSPICPPPALRKITSHQNTQPLTNDDETNGSILF